jgi:hypothetical protein
MCKREQLARVKQWRFWYPVRWDSSSGLFGWQRGADTIDLRRCVFKTKREATLDRDRRARASVIGDPWKSRAREWFAQQSKPKNLQEKDVT